jgi:hypothetical protein
MREVPIAAINQSEYFMLTDSATGARKTGLVAANVDCSYTRDGGLRVAITDSDLGAVDAAWSSGGFKEVDATNCPGLYRFDVPNAAFAYGAQEVLVTIKGAAIHAETKEFNLVPPLITQGSINATERTQTGLTGVITGAANNGAGLIRITDVTHGLTSNDYVAIAAVAGTVEANKDGWVITVITADTFDLVGSVYANAYTSGGVWTRNALTELTFKDGTIRRVLA